MTTCPYCGRENEVGHAHCRECGTALAEIVENIPDTPVAAEPPQVTQLDWIQSWRIRTEFVLVISLCLGWFLLGSLTAVVRPGPARPLDDHVLQAITKYELITATLAGVFLWARGWTLQDLRLGFSWLATACAIPLVVVSGYLNAIIVPVLEDVANGGAQLNHVIYTINVSLPWAILASLVNGCFEELVLVGYIMRRWRGFGFGTALGVSVLLRSILHFYQGHVGVASIIALGILFGSFFWFFGRLWALMVAHALLDLLAFTQF
jgi:membrane protease YdiL (CAAX protease family)